MVRLAAAGALILAMGCTQDSAPTLDLATTTSVQNSGLLGHLLPRFEQASGITVRVHAAGSGRALQMLADGVVDGVISHAPETKQRLRALRHASAARGYVLTDASTFWQLAPALELPILFEHDPRLVNTYAVIHPASQEPAATFANGWRRPMVRRRSARS